MPLLLHKRIKKLEGDALPEGYTLYFVEIRLIFMKLFLTVLLSWSWKYSSGSEWVTSLAVCGMYFSGLLLPFYRYESYPEILCRCNATDATNADGANECRFVID